MATRLEYAKTVAAWTKTASSEALRGVIASAPATLDAAFARIELDERTAR